MLKIAVQAPMPSASVSTATAVKPGFFSSWRTANLRSFITQSLHRIDLRRAARGKQTSDASNSAESQHHGGKDPRVCGSNAKQQTLDVVPRRDGQDNAEN